MPGNRRRGTLGGALVRDAMTTPIVTCAPELPLDEVAELMVGHRIHSVVVLAPPCDDAAPAHRRWSVLADLDLVAAAPWGEGIADAGSAAASPQAVIGADETLSAAALLMAEYSTAHLLVTEEGVDEPVGVLSALDVARVLTGARTAPAGPPPPHGPVRAGDRLIIAPHRQGDRPRDAEVLEAHGPDGGPPYLVRWEDTGRVSLHYPASDAAVEHLVPPRPRAGRARRATGDETASPE